MTRLITVCLALLKLSTLALAHGSHGDEGDLKDLDWATRHMIEEHHIGNFDPASFFSLHDYDNSGVWTVNEVRRTYGLDDSSNAHLSEVRKQQIVQDVFAIFDPLKTGLISQADFVRLCRQEGKKLPDFGTGPGHHGDMEYEYEIHHFEKYHGEDAREEDLTHPEDIEHFRLHDDMEDAQIEQDRLAQMEIVEKNIPSKFLRSPPQ